jgi:hypothetical protein
MSIVEFLLARIGEVEDLAKAAAGASVWQSSDPPETYVVTVTGQRLFAVDLADQVHPDQSIVALAAHFAGQMPGQALAECEAKRQIIQLEAADKPKAGAPPYNGPLNDPETGGRHPQLVAYLAQHGEQVTDTPTLRVLAAVYFGHPDYREEWRP